MKLRRSLLYMPGTDWRKIEKAANELDADSVCMDLEDGVAINAKEEARETVVRALKTLDFGRSEKLVRVNNVESPYLQVDLAKILPAHPGGIVVPKVNRGDEIIRLDFLISEAEKRYGWESGSIRLLLIIESAMGIVNLKDIIAGSRRTEGLIFGAEDFASDIGATRSKSGEEVLYARSKVVAYAKAYGLQAIDIVYPDFNDVEGFNKDAQQGMKLGYTGKQLIHPNQVPLINAVYKPTTAELKLAQRIIEAHESHQISGTGAFALDGKMVDMPVVKQAEIVVERAKAAGMLKEANIFAFISDFMFISRVDAACAQLDLKVQYVETADDVGSLDARPDPDRPGEALQGREGALIRLVAEKQPDLLIFDLNADAIPWQRWISLLKSSAATRRIPVLAFGSHMDVHRMNAAREAGADQMIARSRFASDLPALISKHLRSVDSAAIESACAQPLSALAAKGIELFNKGSFFEAHEVLEEAWNEDTSPARELYRVILQVAVAYMQIERGNYRGAAKMFLRLRQWFAPLPDICRGVNVAHLRDAALKVEAELLRLGEDRVSEVNRELFVNVLLVQ